MALQVTYLGHSGFLFSDGTSTLAVDPFLTGNPVATHEPDQIDCQFIALSHGHADHVGDSVAIAKRTGANVIAAYELTDYFGEQGHENVNPANPGGQIATDFGWVALTQAFHSSSYEGRYMGMPCGLVIHLGGKTVYHLGDTTIFGDMALIGEIYQPDNRLRADRRSLHHGPGVGNARYRDDQARRGDSDSLQHLAADRAGTRPTSSRPGWEVKVMEPGESWQVD